MRLINMDINLTPALAKKMANYPRTRGRYNSSELYGITHGYVTPESWMNAPEKEVSAMLKMWNGTLVHDFVQRLLPPGDGKESGCEIKKTLTRDEITLVAKVDYLPEEEDTVWEIKSSEEAMDSSKPSHDYQAKLYCTIFKRPRTRIFQPVSSSQGLWLKEIGIVDRDDEWFDREFAKLVKFHEKVEKLWESKK